MQHLIIKTQKSKSDGLRIERIYVRCTGSDCSQSTTGSDEGRMSWVTKHKLRLLSFRLSREAKDLIHCSVDTLSALRDSKALLYLDKMCLHDIWTAFLACWWMSWRRAALTDAPVNLEALRRRRWKSKSCAALPRNFLLLSNEVHYLHPAFKNAGFWKCILPKIRLLNAWVGHFN